MAFIFGHSEVPGWFYTEQWRYYQKCSGNVVAYIEKYPYFFRVHVSERGKLIVCDIEIRKKRWEDALAVAEEYLEKYTTANKAELWKDYYSPHNPDGYWEKEYGKKVGF